MRKYHKKLVRDKIPDKLNEKSVEFEICQLDSDEEFYDSLVKKLQEETLEFLESNEIQEVGDIQDIIDEILKYRKVSNEDFNKIRSAKTKKNGGITKRIFLVWTQE